MAASSGSAGGEITFEADARLVNVSCFDLLVIELVPLAERMARAYEASLDRPVPSPSSTSTTAKRASKGSSAQGGNMTSQAGGAGPGAGTPAITVTGSTSTPTNANGTSTVSLSAPPSNTPTLLAADGLPSTPIFADSVYVRLERLGFRVGEGLSERFSRDRPRFQNYAGNSSSWVAGGAGTNAGGGSGATVGNINDHQLDVIKFLCKDIWTVVWKKQVDNLKTNHRGVFVLTDSKFRPLMRMSMTNSADALHRAQPHLFFPCGVIRGVLASLGIKASVQAESTDLPGAVFQIKTVVDVGKRGGSAGGTGV